ncbi:MAG: hypothetical protein H6627_00415 [Calditrichae bacterium]|nr:hypothetical protein [Calditrichota bacterium]MCB9056999.1 hypothetical protein [Calditrichia bacterium]
MGKFNSLTRYDLQQAITNNQVLILQIISIAMFAGPGVFFLLIYIINSNKQPLIGESSISETTQILIYAAIALSFVMYGVFLVFPKIFLSASALKSRLNILPEELPNSVKADLLIGIDRTLMIIRFAMLEGIALFASVVLFVEVSNSPMQISGDLWYLATPSLILLAYILYNFPSKENILKRIENEILAKIKNQ